MDYSVSVLSLQIAITMTQEIFYARWPQLSINTYHLISKHDWDNEIRPDLFIVFIKLFCEMLNILRLSSWKSLWFYHRFHFFFSHDSVVKQMNYLQGTSSTISGCLRRGIKFHGGTKSLRLPRRRICRLEFSCHGRSRHYQNLVPLSYIDATNKKSVWKYSNRRGSVKKLEQATSPQSLQITCICKAQDQVSLSSGRNTLGLFRLALKLSLWHIFQYQFQHRLHFVSHLS